jgi:hypothetical protein
VTVASAASAFKNFVVKPVPQEVVAGQTVKHVFTLPGSPAVECEVAKFTSKVNTETSPDGLFRPTYEKCTAFGFPATITTHNHCEYELIAETGAVAVVNFNFKKFQEPTVGETTCGTTKAQGEAKEELEIAVSNGSGCDVLVPAQAGLKKVEYANVTGKNGRKSVEVKIKVEKIKTFSNAKGIGCPANGLEGTYTGASVAEGATGTVEVV